jgi:hypothetical protein
MGRSKFLDAPARVTSSSALSLSISRAVSRSPDTASTEQALRDLRENLSRLSTSGLERAYAEAWGRCKLGVTGKPPRADCIQELVQAWRVLRKSSR